mmetsp:Transcript_101908/g.242954  ORF Transcript_101908/g.242954 Transcript_101908/m.242954 type:complete len:384 (+) Transcript_101908:59-1210(+)
MSDEVTPLQTEKAYGSVPSLKSSKTTSWEAEYAAPWMILCNAMAVVGYQIFSMSFIAYQVLYSRSYVMFCIHGELPEWQLWVCEYTKAYTRFFPLVAILISMSLVRSIILIQRMYYELLRHGAILQFKEYKASREPVFYILIFCFVQGASNWLLEAMTGRHEGSLLRETKLWLVYLVLPITTFILSIYFTHEPAYYLVPLSRYIHANTYEDVEAAQKRVSSLILIDEEHAAAVCAHMDLPADLKPEDTTGKYQELITTSQGLRESGSVIVGQHRLQTKFAKSQIMDRFWPARLLLQSALVDESSKQFRRVSMFYDFVCICAACTCGSLFIKYAIKDVHDLRKGEVEDSSALLVEALHAAYAFYYITQILKTTSILAAFRLKPL